MKNKMKVIDLLNKIANGEDLPKNIKYSGHIYKFDETRNDYENEEKRDWTFFYNKIGKCSNMIDCLNDEFEIIEEKPKEIKEINFRNEKGETLIGANMWEFYYRLDDLRKAVNYLLEKSDKE